VKGSPGILLSESLFKKWPLSSWESRKKVCPGKKVNYQLIGNEGASSGSGQWGLGRMCWGSALINLSRPIDETKENEIARSVRERDPPQKVFR